MLGMIKSRGVLTDNGLYLQPHERLTVDFFLERGNDVELIVPSYTVGRKNADIILYGKTWEMKSPESANINTLMKRLKYAAKQSPNLIIDLRRVKGDEKKVSSTIQTKFRMSKRLKVMLIITKSNQLLEIKKN